MKLDKGVELATVEPAGLHIGQRDALKRIVPGQLEIADAVARSAQGNDLATTVIEGALDRDDPLRDLEERSHGIAFAKHDFSLVPPLLAAKGEQLREADVVERLAQVQ